MVVVAEFGQRTRQLANGHGSAGHWNFLRSRDAKPSMGAERCTETLTHPKFRSSAAAHTVRVDSIPHSSQNTVISLPPATPYHRPADQALAPFWRRSYGDHPGLQGASQPNDHPTRSETHLESGTMTLPLTMHGSPRALSGAGRGRHEIPRPASPAGPRRRG